MLLATGLVVVIGLVALSWDQVTTISAAVAAGGVGGIVLALAQVAALPNLALWVVSFLAGPGFRVVEGGPVTWSGSEGGLLPMVPVLAALPQPGDFPWFTALSVLVVVAVGAFVARRALAEVARLSRLRTKLAVALSACTVTALALAALDLVAGGSVGPVPALRRRRPHRPAVPRPARRAGHRGPRRRVPRRLAAAPLSTRTPAAPAAPVPDCTVPD